MPRRGEWTKAFDPNDAAIDTLTRGVLPQAALARVGVRRTLIRSSMTTQLLRSKRTG